MDRSLRVVKFLNLPWYFTRQDLGRYLARTLEARVVRSEIYYDQKTGLSRGIGLAIFREDQPGQDLVRKGSIDIEGRKVIALPDRNRERTPRSEARSSQS